MPLKNTLEADKLSAEQPQLEHRKLIRALELEQAISYLPQNAKLLEIGAGAGWQAAKLNERGFKVTAIDIPQSNYSAIRVWPIIDYDGVRIPLEDQSVDAIFSSNVLEHVPHIEAFQKEMQRVLKPNGIAVHVMPSATWRLWTSITFYIDRIKKLYLKLNRKKSALNNRDPITRHSENKGKVAPLRKIKSLTIPSRHGERGTVLGEMYYFSRLFWVSLFKKSGWKVEKVVPNGILYSGQHVFGNRIDIETRNRLASFLGSSCIFYILRKP